MNAEEKLFSIIELLEVDKITPADLEEFLKMVVEAIQEDRTLNQKDKEALTKRVTLIENKLSSLLSADEEKWKKIMAKVALLKDGVSPDKNEIIREVVSLIPTPKNGTVGQIGPKGSDGSPDRPEDIRGKLESLKGDERLDKSAIRGLKEEIESMTSKLPKGYSIGGGTRAASVHFHDLSSYLNGVTKTFALPKHKKVISVMCSSNPGVMRPTVDYTMSGNNITFTSEINAASTLATGQTVIILYGQLFGP